MAAARRQNDEIMSWPRHLAAVLMTLAMSLGAGIAVAQYLGPPPTPAQAKVMVTAVTATDVSATETRLLVVFNGPAPPYSIIANNADTVIVALTGSALAPSVVAPSGRHGAVQAVTFAQNDSILTLSLSGGGPLRVTAAPTTGRAVALSIVGPAAAPAIGLGPPAPIVPHADIAPGDAFEVVPLKYADVSEIVGLLTSGQGVKPNDNFTPQEPAFGSSGMSSAYGGALPSQTPSGAGGFAAAPTDSLGQTVDDTVGVDRRLNAIILRGPAARVALLKAQIAMLDVPVSSVLLETVFVELTESGARNVGLDFTNGNSQIATVSYALNHGGFPNLTDTARNGAVSANLQAAVYAQIKNGQGRIVSKPRIAAQSGSTARFSTSMSG
jgi:general secretion pathway protein D